LCTDESWKPKVGIKLWKVVDGKQTLPLGNPCHVTPIPMKNLDDIIKGLSSFINLWESMANIDSSGSYRTFYGSLIQYWRDTRDALKMVPPPPQNILVIGFWPRSWVFNYVNDTFLANGKVKEEYDANQHYIGLPCNQPRPSFHVARDCCDGYMLFI
jgi:hypothetical protein